MSTTRRGMIEAAGSAGLLAIAAVCFAKPEALAAAPAEHPDADLIAACAAFDDTEHRFKGYHGEGAFAALRIKDDDERDIALDAMAAERDALLERIWDLEATTIEGFRARARTAKLYHAGVIENVERCQCGEDETMLYALVRDLLGGDMA
jgi:hypothetical protein